VLDLGAGTGKLTSLLADRCGRVVALEPVAAMRAKLAERLPEGEVLAGRAEAIPLQASSVDAAFAAEAFHWFDPDRAVAELARVLRPGGGVGLLWNVHAWAEESHPWLTDLRAALERYRTEAVARHIADQGRWRASFERCESFEPIRAKQFRHEQPLDVEGLMAQLSSWSWVAGLPRPRRDAALAAVRSAVKRDLDRRRETEVVIPYRTELYWTQRREVA
jgi:ubiquinone/menaquinone biosynthesis C-methylase UbiE